LGSACLSLVPFSLKSHIEAEEEVFLCYDTQSHHRKLETRVRIKSVLEWKLCWWLLLIVSPCTLSAFFRSLPPSLFYLIVYHYCMFVVGILLLQSFVDHVYYIQEHNIIILVFVYPFLMLLLC
jgi:hypothetical protein